MTIKELADKLKVSEKNNQKRFRKTQKRKYHKKSWQKRGILGDYSEKIDKTNMVKLK